MKNITKTFIDVHLKNLMLLDDYIRDWEHNFLKVSQKPSIALSTKGFILAILGDPATLCIKNNFIYFMTNPFVRIPIRSETNIFLVKWFDLFRKRTPTENCEYDYDHCVSQEDVDEQLPRRDIVCRYICLAIRQSVFMTADAYLSADMFPVLGHFRDVLAELLLLKTPHSALFFQLYKSLYNVDFLLFLFMTWVPETMKYPELVD